jgi:hypothetical protein
MLKNSLQSQYNFEKQYQRATDHYFEACKKCKEELAIKAQKTLQRLQIAKEYCRDCAEQECQLIVKAQKNKLVRVPNEVQQKCMKSLTRAEIAQNQYDEKKRKKLFKFLG